MAKMFVKILIRLTTEQYAWLRQHCFDARISQAEVVRRGLELYRQRIDDAGEKKKKG